MVTCRGAAQLWLDLAKATFDNTAASLGTIQAMVEDRAVSAVCGAAWVPDLVGGLVSASVGAARQVRGEFTAVVDRCYAGLSRLVGSA